MNLLSILLSLALDPSHAFLHIQIVPEADSFSAVLSAPGPDIPGGLFDGTIALNGSAAAVPIAGRLQRSGGRLVLPVRVRYADVPADWAERFRAASFDYRLRGRVRGGSPLEWAGTLRWNRVEVRGDPERASDFFHFVRLELARLTFRESEARAEMWVRNPFSFPIRIASSRYRLYANGREIGGGENRGLVLAPRARSTIRLPIDVRNGALLATAGSTVLSGGEVDGRLTGELRIRTARGEVPVPLQVSGRLSIVR